MVKVKINSKFTSVNCENERRHASPVGCRSSPDQRPTPREPKIKSAQKAMVEAREEDERRHPWRCAVVVPRGYLKRSFPVAVAAARAPATSWRRRDRRRKPTTGGTAQPTISPAHQCPPAPSRSHTLSSPPLPHLHGAR
jgi:hypothetical protein